MRVFAVTYTINRFMKMVGIKWIRLHRFGSRRANLRAWPLLVVTSLLAGALLWGCSELGGALARMVGAAPADLGYLRRNRDLYSYVEDISDPLIEPSSPCEGQVPLLALVTSAPAHTRQRRAIRTTWGPHLHTFFFLGLEDDANDQLVDNYVEAKQHGDLVVFRFPDAYHNLTLKTALMLHWARRRCAHAHFLLKTDDDVLVNPWTLRELLGDNADAQLVGYRMTDGAAHRSPYNKWHLPRWLYPQDSIPEWLSGTGYLLNGQYLRSILDTAYKVPLINLEDVYFTFLVAKQALGLSLTHDSRLSPYQPLVPVPCAYWDFALVHSLGPRGIHSAWSKLQGLGKEYQSGKPVCEVYRRYFSLFSSYALLY